MDMKKYINELKRRNVFKAAIAYLIVAWIIAQVASVFLPAFNAPPFILKTILFILIIGFPLNLIFAWVYEITSDGLKKTENVDQNKSISPKTGSRLNKVIIASLSIAVLLLLFNQFWNKPINNTDKQELSEVIYPAKDDNKSIDYIAVLPFHNSKPNPETDFLGFALCDQIIGDLRYFKNIIVRPSSSVRKYEEQTIDPKAVRDDLNVDYVLIGNYLIESESIRLNIELIDVNTDELIWREPIEVNYNNAFELQDIVAKKVIEGMNIQFSEKEINTLGKNTPNDPLAYEYYLRSLSYSSTDKDNKLAAEMLNKSIELDSNYAPAYNQLGLRIHSSIVYGSGKSEDLKIAENLFMKALSIDDELLEAYANLSGLYTETGRTEDAMEITRIMLEINPNNADAHFALGYIYRYAGLQNESVLEMEMGSEIDPSNPGFANASLSYYNLGEYEKAHRALEINDVKSLFETMMMGFIYAKQGEIDSSKKYLKQVIDVEPDHFFGLISQFYLAYFNGNREECLRILKMRKQKDITDGEPIYYDAVGYALIGSKEGCIRNLQKAIDHGYFNYPLMLTDTDLDSMRDDPEFQEILLEAKAKHEAFKKRFF
jgi:TolB-like protein/Flp pilus assembly protein TadD